MPLSNYFDDQHTVVRGSVKAEDKTANFTVTLPAGYIVDRILIQEKAAAAITGGVRVGTTDGGAQVAAAIAVGASAVAVSAALIPGYSAADQTLYVQAVTSWNSATVDFAMELTKIDA